jgi:integrase
MSHLSSVFNIAKPAWGIPLDREQMRAAFAVTKQLGMTTKSDKRDRRPTLEELDALMAFFGDRQERSPDSAPMQRIIAYALFSTRRMEEIVRPLWKHLDVPHSRLLIKDMKHPGQKLGNDVWVDLPPPALAIIEAMPRSSGPIFPYSTDAIGAAFTRACKVLGIADLHFHDLRHEGVSRLFEMGLSIPRVAAVSGHRSWQSLQRYTHLRQTGDKYADWKWLPAVTTPAGPSNVQRR